MCIQRRKHIVIIIRLPIGRYYNINWNLPSLIASRSYCVARFYVVLCYHSYDAWIGTVGTYEFTFMYSYRVVTTVLLSDRWNRRSSSFSHRKPAMHSCCTNCKANLTVSALTNNNNNNNNEEEDLYERRNKFSLPFHCIYLKLYN